LEEQQEEGGKSFEEDNKLDRERDGVLLLEWKRKGGERE
jgi:hypothetical protein